VILFAANRPEADRVGPAWSVDPAYGRRLVEVLAGGVEALAVRLVHTADGIVAGDALPVDVSADVNERTNALTHSGSGDQ
jgi:DNA-binding sugar fermentation-stimulating protein